MGSKYKPIEPPQWVGTSSAVNLRPYIEEPPFLNFASDGSKYLIAWLPPLHSSNPQDWEKALGKWVITDFSGQIIKSAKKDGDPIPQSFIYCFPQVSWRSQRMKFVRNFKYWRFSDNLKYCFRSNDTDMQFLKIEKKPVVLWEKKLPKVAFVDFSIVSIEFISWHEKECILLGFWGEVAVILNRQNGSIIGALTYRPPNSEEKEKAYRKKFNLSEGGEFKTTCMAWNKQKRWIACGEFTGRRIRVISIDPPHPMIIELNPDDHPHRPWGGVWSVRNINFSTSGKYLIAEYKFSGRLTSKYFEPTEIYDTQTWQKCWYENSYHIDHVTLSPDEKNIVYIRLNRREKNRKWIEKDKILEIGTFIPGVVE